MTQKTDLSAEQRNLLKERFGSLPHHMMEMSDVRFIWKISFLANHFNLPMYREIKKATGLGRPEVVILLCLREQANLTANDICLATGQLKNSISRAMSELIANGLVSRTTNTNDKRAKTLNISDSGIEIINSIIYRFAKRQEAMWNTLSTAEQDTFLSLLNKLVGAMPAWVDNDVEIP